ncbi:hypothetical protein I4U23_009321 [Adineta vaga]|nr:hypothetical protein I4U23_009321 [Adineta vaga]
MSSETTNTDGDGYQQRNHSNSHMKQNELSHLEADANIPLDELLKLYKNDPSVDDHDISQEEESYSSSELEDDDDRREGEDERKHNLFHVNGDLLPDGDDTEDSLYEPDILKFVNIGEEYQAHIESKAEYDSVDECTDDREVPSDELLWSSSLASDTDDENIDDYLKKTHIEYPSSNDEISLQTLLNCQFNTDLALMKFRQLPIKMIYSYATWSLNEIQEFEEGLRKYGKNFYKISVFKCSNRSVHEIIYFYYQWKKSERYELFIEEQQRMNSLASVSHIIGKFIEEQEQHMCSVASVTDSSSSSSSSSSSTNFLLNDYKTHSPLPSDSSISFITIHQHETTSITTKRTYDQVDNDNNEVSSKKPLFITNSSIETTATTI